MRNVMRGGVMRGGVMLGGVMRSQRGGFDPLTLFSAGQQGAWYEPSDLTTVFQDSAGTTPAAVGDPVGLLLDKSGNGNHASQSVAASRPLLQSDGILYWLQGDGIDDFLVIPAGLNGKIVSVAVETTVEYTSTSSAATVVQTVSDVLGGGIVLGSITSQIAGEVVTHLVARRVGSASPLPAGAHVLSAWNDGTDPFIRIDGADATDLDEGNADAISWPTDEEAGLFASPEGIRPWAGRIFGFIAANDSSNPLNDLANIESYLAKKNGASL